MSPSLDEKLCLSYISSENLESATGRRQRGGREAEFVETFMTPEMTYILSYLYADFTFKANFRPLVASESGLLTTIGFLTQILRAEADAACQLHDSMCWRKNHTVVKLEYKNTNTSSRLLFVTIKMLQGDCTGTIGHMLACEMINSGL